MSTWSFLINFNDESGNHDITSYVLLESIKRKRQLWKDLKPVVGTLTFDMQRNITIITKLLTTDGRIDITVTKDSEAFFKGTVRSNLKVSVRNVVRPVSIECVDYGDLLERKIKDTFQWASYKVCDTANTSTSIVHQLLDKAGFASGDISISTDIDKTIDYFVNVPVHKESTYAAVLSKILFEFGYVYYWGADGKLRIYNFLPADTTTTDALDNSNMLEELTIQKKLTSYEGAEVRFYDHKTEADAVVFNDTTGGDSMYPCNIELAPSGYYPEGAGDRSVYSEYQFEGGEIVVVLDAAMSVTKDAEITYDTEFVNYYKRGLFGLVNGAGIAKNIRKLQIVGDVVYRSDMGKSRCNLVADTEKLFGYDAEFITAMADADVLSIGLARYFKYSDFTYTVKSKAVYDLGAIVDVEDEMLGIDNRCVVVGIEDVDAELALFRYTLEGISEYSAESVTNEGVFTPAPPPAPGTGPAVIDGTAPTYTEIIEGFTDGGGTKTPTVPTIAVCKPVGTHAILLQWDRQLDLTNFSRYEVQVSPDDSTWYSLKFDGTDYKDTEDADTDWASEVLVHAGIPNTGDADNPAGQALYYRVRRVTKEPAASAWSSSATATTNVVATGDLAANSVYANNLRADSITATLMQTGLLAASVAVVIGYSGTGTPADPDEGDRRVYIDEDELGMQEYTNGAWTTVNQIQIGGVDDNGVFLPFLGCRGLYGAEPPDSEPLPDEQFFLFDFDDDYLAHDGTDFWYTKVNVTLGSGKFGNCVTRNTNGTGSLAAILEWTPGEDQAAAFWLKGGADDSREHRVLWYLSDDTESDVTGFEICVNGTVVSVKCTIDDVLAGTVQSDSGAIEEGVFSFVGFVFIRSSNTMYLIVDSKIYSTVIDDLWSTLGTTDDILIYLYLQENTDWRQFYIDDMIIRPDISTDPLLLLQHYQHGQPWTAEYSALDVVLKPAAGGVVRALGDLAVSGDIFEPSGKVYDTGWINRSDWTNVHLGSDTTKDTDSNVTHNLNAPLCELLVKVFISTDGTDANSFEINYNDFTTAGTAYRGITVFQVDLNSIKVQIATDGLSATQDSGALITIDTENWYYKIKVWHLG